MKIIATSLLALGLAMPAAATTLQVTITNNSAPEGLFFTPFLHVAHDGSYSPFTAGDTASAGLEALAEVGDTSLAAAEAAGAGRQIGTLTDPAGFGSQAGQPPVFDPGNSNSFTIDLTAGLSQFTLLSMIIPSNDTFVEASFDLFQADGSLNLGSFAVNRDSVYDSGTEVNQSFGQAFNPSDGNGPGFLGDDEGGVVHLSSDVELATLFGQPTPLGFDTSDAGFRDQFGRLDFSNILTVTVTDISPVPLPAAGWAMVVALGGLGAMGRRKKAAQKAN